jgi:hypothetical protein
MKFENFEKKGGVGEKRKSMPHAPVNRNSDKMKEKTYHATSTVQKSNRKIIESYHTQLLSAPILRMC